MRIRIFSLAPALGMLLGGGLSGLVATDADAAACTDGVDCVCDVIKSQYPDVFFCDDFENPGYDKAGPLQPGHAWYDNYGNAAGDDCEGPNGRCYVNVVKSNACAATNETDCVFDGKQSLGHPYKPGETGGISGEAHWEGGMKRTFGITYALRFSPTFQEGNGTKMNRTTGGAVGPTGTKQEVLGQGASEDAAFYDSNGRYKDSTFFGERNIPYQAHIDHDTCGSAPASPCTTPPTVIEGLWGENAVHIVMAPHPDHGIYDWERTNGPGEWMCHKVHYKNWGTANAEVRHWINGKLVIHIKNMDMRRIKAGDENGQDAHEWDNFRNTGYDGPNVAYRYEDNFVITSADEPVPCEAIGFDIFDGSGNPDPDSGTTTDPTPTPDPTTTPDPTPEPTPTPDPTTSGPQEPYGDTAAAIPGRIQIEAFDLGVAAADMNDPSSADSAWHDWTPGNGLGAFRTDADVDIQSTSDPQNPGGFSLGSVGGKEWVEHTVQVGQSAAYTLQIRLATAAPGTTIRFEVDGTSVTDSILLPDSGGENSWTTVTVEGVSLDAGLHTLRTVFETGNTNVNWIEFSLPSAPPVEPIGQPGTPVPMVPEA